MKFIIGTRIWISIGSIFLVLIVLGAISYGNTRQLTETARQVQETHAIGTHLAELLSALKDAETGQRGFLITGEQRYLQPYDDARQAIAREQNALATLAIAPAEQAKLAELAPLVASKLEELQQTIDLRQHTGFDAARRVVLTDKGKSVMDEIRRTIGTLQVVELDRLRQQQQLADDSTHSLNLALMLGTGLAAVLVAISGLVLTRSTFALIDRLGIEMRASAGVLTTSASEIVAITSQVAAGAAQTASAVNETTVTVEEVKQAAAVSSQKARAVSDSAQKVAQVSVAGQQAVSECQQGMQRIQEQMTFVADSILRLSEQSQAIGEIIASVNDLTEQSNLLAVNAAIEAAKAGEQGRGFGVVATEMKSLAEQSRQATAQVRTILGETQKATSSAVMATEQGSRAVALGVKQTQEAGETIRLLSDSIGDAARAATQIAASSQQQMVGMDQVAQAMDSIKLASQQNVGSTRQAELAAHNLSESGQKMVGVLEQFRL